MSADPFLDELATYDRDSLEKFIPVYEARIAELSARLERMKLILSLDESLDT